MLRPRPRALPVARSPQRLCPPSQPLPPRDVCAALVLGQPLGVLLDGLATALELVLGGDSLISWAELLSEPDSSPFIDSPVVLLSPVVPPAREKFITRISRLLRV